MDETSRLLPGGRTSPGTRAHAAIDVTTSRDHVLAFLKASIEAVPFVGGTISSLIDDYIPTERSRRLIEFVERVREDLSSLAERVDRAYVQSADFSYLFERALKHAADCYRLETRYALSAVLAASTVRFDEDELLKQALLETAASLTPEQVIVLGYIAGHHTSVVSTTRRTTPLSSANRIVHLIGTYCLPHADEALIIACLGQLTARGLIRPFENDMIAALERSGLLQPDSSQRGAYSVSDLRRYVTALGHKLLAYLAPQ